MADGIAVVRVLAAPVLRAPDDPGAEGLLIAVALLLILGLLAAHVRLLRAVARATVADVAPGDSAVDEPGRPSAPR